MTSAEPAAARTDVDRVIVELGPRSYPVLVGDGLLDAAGAILAPYLPRPRVAIVTDAQVAPLYLEQLIRALERAGIAHDAVILPAGEATKDFATVRTLCETLLDAGIERATTLIALGGGVIGDITGFAAGILLRGIPFVQIPTTLLAQVDSSVGGKTGINSRKGKNLIGVFHQPLAVLADVGTLDTLDSRQRRAGYAEVVKYGLIGDTAFFEWLEARGSAVLEGDRPAQRRAVATSCRAKAAIVAADEREAGDRALLNLGHTFGHAFEAATGFGEALLHGEAVALGMIFAFRLSVRRGLCPEEDLVRLCRHLDSLRLPTDLKDVDHRTWSPGALLEHMRRDKKVRDGRVTFVLARGIGRAFICRDVSEAEVEDLLGKALEA
jgi:3-dehydroquinate synthase